MKLFKTAILAAATGFTSLGHAHGYITNSYGEVVRNAAGECWHSPYWQPADAIVGCDGVVAAEKVVVTEPAPAVVAPVAAPVPLARLEPVLFAFDSADLSGGARDALDRWVDTVRGAADAGRLRITGYTDRIGPENYNLGLSERRAEAVRTYLGPRMPASVEYDVSGKGETGSVTSCQGEEGNALIQCLRPDRRVEVELAPGS